MLANDGPVQTSVSELHARSKRNLNVRILLVTPDLENSGIGRQALDLALRVRAAGGHPHVASPGGMLKLELQRQKIPHKTLPDVSTSALGHMVAVHQLAAYVREAQIHFMHAVDFSLGRFVYEVMLKTGRHVAVSLNQPVLNTLSNKGVEILRSFTRIFVPSNFAREQLIQQLQLPESVVSTVIPGINLSIVHHDRISPQKIMDLEKKWQIPDEHPLVVVPDCPTDAVLFDTLATVLRELKEKNVFTVLFVPESERNFILRRVATAGLKSHVVVASDMNDRIPALWLTHSVLVTGFWGRDSLLALIEAQAMGRPIVAFDRNGTGEILLKDPATFLLSADQIGRLSATLIKSLTLSTEHRTTFARRARAYVESNFERTQMYDDIMDVYRDIKDIQN